MASEWIRQHCLSFPHVTETVQWGNNLVFKIGGKMFAVMCLEPAPVALSFKCMPEEYAELIVRPSIIPAPYLARAHWVALETEPALTHTELKRLLRTAYDQVLSKLPKKTQAALA
jgi:predicted DNA-binding protein (MmcQ/YjbR family)